MRFDVGGAIVAVTPGVFLLYDHTDNANYDASEGTEPTSDQWLNDLLVSADAACKVEVGLCLANRTGFVPYYATYATKAAGGHVEHLFSRGSARYKLVMSHATIKRLAVRVTVAADSTVHVAGSVSIAKA